MAAKKSSGGRKYGAAAGKSVKRAMDRMKRGTLKGGKGAHPKVTSRKQAIAIGLAEAREKGAKVPAKKSVAKKSTAKKSAAKKSTAKKSTTKKASSRKSTTKRSSAKKSSS